jgi:UDP-N-acetylmuramate dehydrogenase
MRFETDFSIKKLNTFGVDVKTKYYAEVASIEDCLDVLKRYKDERILLLGDGSNTLFVHDWPGIIIKSIISGKEIVAEREDTVHIKVGSGENWDAFVRWCVEQNYGGLENLVLIPGTVGGAVAQNIAAYGQNISDALVSVSAINMQTLQEETIAAKDCAFEYRDSIFKRLWDSKYLITSAVFYLDKNPETFELNYHERAGRYGSIMEELKSMGRETIDIQMVMEAVIRQRNKRLPSVDEMGTCGSFFKNPVIPVEKYRVIAAKVNDLQSYPVQKLDYSHQALSGAAEKGAYVKIPAGRLLDELGWRGKWQGNVGVHDKHALCVVTNFNASGKDILTFVQQMREDVRKHYDVDLEMEINLIDVDM